MAAQHIIVGCDLHDKSMVLIIGADHGKPYKRTFDSNTPGREKMIQHLKQFAHDSGAPQITFTYEASCLGHGLHDQLSDVGITCYILAPTKIQRSPHQRKRKNDEQDARQLHKMTRDYVLCGGQDKDFPRIWVPDLETRAHRELVRMRLRAGEDAAKCKLKIHGWLKVHDLRKPKEINNWTQEHWAWLVDVAKKRHPGLDPTAQFALQSLLRQLRTWEKEIQILDRQIAQLAQTPRYAEPVAALTKEIGVATLSAMVFLTEMGDLRRFANRRQIGAYLGLVPSQHSTGETDHKGHITRQGSPRVRKILCQCVWARIKHDPATKAKFKQIDEETPGRKKIQTVAHMRKLAIKLWHKGLAAQLAAGSFDGPAPAARR